MVPEPRGHDRLLAPVVVLGAPVRTLASGHRPTRSHHPRPADQQAAVEHDLALAVHGQDHPSGVPQ